MFKYFSLFTLSVIPLCHGAHLSCPQEALIDQPIQIRVEQLDAFQKFSLLAEAEDAKGEIWSAKVDFQVDEYDSSYVLSDGMRLFWAMTPRTGPTSDTFKCRDDRMIVTLKLFVNGLLECQKSVTRYLLAPNVTRVDIREDGLVGTLFLPMSDHPLPLIITLSGSNGGLSESRAKLLASRGFATIALAYFREEGLPQTLANIELEYFERAFTWIKKQPEIDSSRISLYGVSRGGELALLLGTLFPSTFHSIVACVPSSAVYAGLSNTPEDAWLYHGKPLLPSAPMNMEGDGMQGKEVSDPIKARNGFIEGMRDTASFERARIPVEKIVCPLLIISGGDDQMWPSDIFANQIRDHSPHCKHLAYPHAGHGITFPYLPEPEPIYFHPVAKKWFTLGGTRARNAGANADFWPHLLDFFANEGK